MSQLAVCIMGPLTSELEQMMHISLEGVEYSTFETAEALMKEKEAINKVLFIVQLDEIGISMGMYQFIQWCQKNKVSFEGTCGAIMIHSVNQLYTKREAQKVIFMLNQMGMAFMGHPLIEAIEELKNFEAWQLATNMSKDAILHDKCKNLIERLINYEHVHMDNPKILALHASSRATSNTMMLWDKIKVKVDGDISECHVEDGTIVDCIGCSFRTCVHYSKDKSCFYGGIMVEEVLPAIEEADIIIWLCPNYNDAISAKLMAVVNRLTVLYRRISLYEKSIYALVVSGNSGSDSVAMQLIGALNINKGFRLPPYFCMMEMAYNPGDIMKVSTLDRDVSLFSKHVNKYIKGAR